MPTPVRKNDWEKRSFPIFSPLPRRFSLFLLAWGRDPADVHWRADIDPHRALRHFASPRQEPENDIQNENGSILETFHEKLETARLLRGAEVVL